MRVARDTLTYALGSVSTSPGVTVETSLQFVVGLTIPSASRPPSTSTSRRRRCLSTPRRRASRSAARVRASTSGSSRRTTSSRRSTRSARSRAGGDADRVLCEYDLTVPDHRYVWRFSNGTTSFGPSPPRRSWTSLLDGQLTVPTRPAQRRAELHGRRRQREPRRERRPGRQRGLGPPGAVQRPGNRPGVGRLARVRVELRRRHAERHRRAERLARLRAARVLYRDVHRDRRRRRRRHRHPHRHRDEARHDAVLHGRPERHVRHCRHPRASLVDEYGQAVSGRQVSFQVGSEGPFGATTSGTGAASRAYTPGLSAGSYAGTVTFAAGDTLYEAAAANFTFAVARKATTVTYTGALSGGPNKTVALSAVLKDAPGRPWRAGRSRSRSAPRTRMRSPTQQVSRRPR